MLDGLLGQLFTASLSTLGMGSANITPCSSERSVRAARRFQMGVSIAGSGRGRFAPSCLLHSRSREHADLLGGAFVAVVLGVEGLEHDWGTV